MNPVLLFVGFVILAAVWTAIWGWVLLGAGHPRSQEQVETAATILRRRLSVSILGGLGLVYRSGMRWSERGGGDATQGKIVSRSRGNLPSLCLPQAIPGEGATSMTKRVEDIKGISRRTITRGAVVLAGLAAAFAASFPVEDADAQTKLSHAVAKYQDQPKNGQQCSTCVNFVAPAACRIVADPISPHGWCQFYAAKKAE